ncbi:G5 domain-containing protein [Candidatus Saccharibacteria bacterium]|nr:G5 domain-containing protein [Candidatus Saccharibacteria bacterium]
MKLLRHKISKRYKAAQASGKRQVKQRPYIIPILGLVLGFIIVAAALLGGNGKTLRPSEAHVVFLFDKGDRQVIDTKAKTVGDMLGKLPLHLIPEDVVEPSLDTPIPEDNFRVNIYRARPVTVVDSGRKIVTLTAQKSPRVVAQNAGLDLNPEDLATFDQGHLEENVIGEKVVVARATPVSLNLYGAQLTTYTQATNVEQFLAEKRIELEHGETVQPAKDTPITPNLPVFVLRKDAKIVTAEEPVAPPEQIVNDPSLSFGTTVVRQQGAPGKKVLTYILQTDAAGKEISRQVLQEVILQDPVPQITARGSTVAIASDKTGLMAAAGISPGDYAYANYIVSRESNWRVTAQNASGAYGLCQALPGSKMASAGGDWQANPVTQLRWCNGYARERYGGWGGAYNFWLNNRYW